MMCEAGRSNAASARHLIELGGLVVKSGVADLTNDDRVTSFGALIWIADKLRSDDADRAKTLWAKNEKMAFVKEQARHEQDGEGRYVASLTATE